MRKLFTGLSPAGFCSPCLLRYQNHHTFFQSLFFALAEAGIKKSLLQKPGVPSFIRNTPAPAFSNSLTARKELLAALFNT